MNVKRSVGIFSAAFFLLFFFLPLLNGCAGRQPIPKQQARAIDFDRKGAEFFRQGQFKKALDFYQKALSIHSAGGGEEGHSLNFNNIGSVNLSLGKREAAREMYKKNENSMGISTGSANLGRLYEAMGEWEKARDHYLRARRVNEYLGLKERSLQDLFKIADLYESLGKPEEAGEFRKRAQELTS